MIPAIPEIPETGIDFYSGAHLDDWALAHGEAMIAKRKPHQYAHIAVGDGEY